MAEKHLFPLHLTPAPLMFMLGLQLSFIWSKNAPPPLPVGNLLMLLLLALRESLTRPQRRISALALADLREGEEGTIERIDLPLEDAQRIMELGFVPGARVTVGRAAPGGDPRVYRVDGSEVALRRETAARLRLRQRSAGRD